MVLLKSLLNPRRKAPTGPRISFRGFSIIVQRAGVSVRATITERITEMETVSANCLYNWPVMPPMKETGTNTAQRTSATTIFDRITAAHGVDCAFA